MSPTLKNSVSLQSLSFVRVSRMMVVPVGLHVGREADHTALLEATAEGILLVVTLAMLPTNSSKFVWRSRWLLQKMGKFVCREGIETYPSAGAETVRVRHNGGVLVGAGELVDDFQALE